MAARQPATERSGWRAALAAVVSCCLLLTASVDGKPLGGNKRSLAARVLNGVSGFKPVFVTIGDSITEFGGNEGGWQLMLSRDYVRKADVINRGFSGYNSRWGTYLVDEIVETFGDRVELATVCFGANDAAGPSTSVGYLSVPLEEYANNIRTIVTKLMDHGITNIVIMTPPPVNDGDGRFTDGARSNDRAKKYAEAALSVARSLKLPHINLHAGIQEQADWRNELMNVDGLHMSREGNRFIYEKLIDTVRSKYPRLSPPQLPLHFPSYDRINVTAPAQTFDPLLGHIEAVAAAAASKVNGGSSSKSGSSSSGSSSGEGSGSSSSSSGEGSSSSSSSSSSVAIDPLASFSTTRLLGMAEQAAPGGSGAPAGAGPESGLLANTGAR